DERTAHHDVVSTAAQRISVHLPKQQRLVLFGGQLPGLQEIGLPRNLEPLFFLSGRLDQLMQRFEPIRRKPLGGSSSAQPEHDRRNRQDRQPACGGHGFSSSRLGNRSAVRWSNGMPTPSEVRS